eukprot:TRINITY_DN10815_c0_g1_i1.p1 TRINITY_DN10815_c0_g1~~TRINITY_DN10815_c0_g1_i1.p1  ORF type:complete len:338 (-),score=62.82 TRINITY_DN10815_c0_g1_i1:121-1134(-)
MQYAGHPHLGFGPQTGGQRQIPPTTPPASFAPHQQGPSAPMQRPSSTSYAASAVATPPPAIHERKARLASLTPGSIKYQQIEEEIKRYEEEEEFKAWMEFIGLGQYVTQCVASGYAALDTLQLRTETEMTEWAEMCHIPAGFHRRLQDKKASIEQFRIQFRQEQRDQEERERLEREQREQEERRLRELHEQEEQRKRDVAAYRAKLMHDCTQQTDSLGTARKRGINRTEKWRSRHFFCIGGHIEYYRKGFWGSYELKGWSALSKASISLEPMPPSNKSSTEVWVNLFVDRPVMRRYLISLPSQEYLQKWQEVILRQREFCDTFPEAVKEFEGYRVSP